MHRRGARIAARLGSQDRNEVLFGAQRGSLRASLDDGDESTYEERDHASLPASRSASGPKRVGRVGVAKHLQCATRGPFYGSGVSASS